MRPEWKHRVRKVNATLQTAACLGAEWSQVFSGDGEACGVGETPSPDSVRSVVRSAAIRLEHHLNEALLAWETGRRREFHLESLRAQRNEARRELSKGLVRLRRLVAAHSGVPYAAGLFPKGRIPHPPQELRRLGRTILRRLERGLPAARKEPVLDLDLEVLTEDLQHRVTRLETALQEVAAGEASALLARRARDQASSRLARTQSGVDRLFEGFSALAG